MKKIHQALAVWNGSASGKECIDGFDIKRLIVGKPLIWEINTSIPLFKASATETVVKIWGMIMRRFEIWTEVSGAQGMLFPVVNDDIWPR